MYRLMVIDDEFDKRAPSYYKLFEGFAEIEFAKNPAKLETEIRDSCVSAFFVDYQLWGPGDFIRALKAISEFHSDIPVFIVSQYWDKTDTLLALKEINEESNLKPSDFFSWQSLNIEGEHGCMKARIQQSLNMHYGRILASPALNDSVNILHISDLQFGDPDRDNSLFRVHDTIYNTLQHDFLLPDIVVISGDVTFSGLPDQFSDAEKWIQKLLEQLWPSEANRYERLVLVPGNHDIDFRMLHAATIDWSVEKKEPNSRSSASDGYCGYWSYIDFAQCVTHGSQPLPRRTKLFTPDDRFLNWGIRFFLFNSAANLTLDEPSQCVILEDCTDAACEKISKCVNKKNNIFTIAVSHHGFEQQDTKGFSNREHVESVFEIANVHLLLHGHGHGRNIVHRQMDPLHGLVELMAPPLTLNSRVRVKDQFRGFNLLSLHRINGEVSAIELHPYDIIRTNCEKTKNSLSYKWKKRRT